jgi:hypothetical protein
MSLKALLASVVLLGTSSAALAQPVMVRDHRDVDGAWFRNHRTHRTPVRYSYSSPWYWFNASYSTYAPPVYEQPVYQPPVYQEPVYQEPVYQAPVASSLMPPTALATGVLRLEVKKPLIEGKTTLRISASGRGSTYINEIVLNQWSGAQQVLDLHTTFDARNPYYDIPLASCADLGGIVMTGQSLDGGAISISAI